MKIAHLKAKNPITLYPYGSSDYINHFEFDPNGRGADIEFINIGTEQFPIMVFSVIPIGNDGEETLVFPEEVIEFQRFPEHWRTITQVERQMAQQEQNLAPLVANEFKAVRVPTLNDEENYDEETNKVNASASTVRKGVSAIRQRNPSR